VDQPRVSRKPKGLGEVSYPVLRADGPAPWTPGRRFRTHRGSACRHDVHRLVTQRFPQRDPARSHAGLMLTLDHTFLVDDYIPTGVGRRRAGRRCLPSERRIDGGNGFGLSEGVCSLCVQPPYVARDSRLRSLIRRVGRRVRHALATTRATCHRSGVHDSTAGEFRAA